MYTRRVDFISSSLGWAKEIASTMQTMLTMNIAVCHKQIYGHLANILSALKSSRVKPGACKQIGFYTLKWEQIQNVKYVQFYTF